MSNFVTAIKIVSTLVAHTRRGALALRLRDGDEINWEAWLPGHVCYGDCPSDTFAELLRELLDLWFCAEFRVEAFYGTAEDGSVIWEVSQTYIGR